MNSVDYLLIGAISMVLIFAVRACIRNHSLGKNCSGDCSHCGHSCGK